MGAHQRGPRTSTMNASAAPFASPSGTIVPASPKLGSVVGEPSGASAQPSGITSPFCLAVINDPAALWTVRVHNTRGTARQRGRKAIGLVPKTALPPPQGAIAAGVLAKSRATSPCSASFSTCRPAAPQWLDRLIGAAAIP